jgi:hypothetical protein
MQAIRSLEFGGKRLHGVSRKLSCVKRRWREAA